MSLKEYVTRLETSVNPVAFNMVAGKNCKVSFLLLKMGMSLKAHKTNVEADLYVLEGCIKYADINRMVILNTFDKIEINSGVVHSVECIDDAKCLLIQML